MIEIIPAIDIIGGKCTRLSQGDYATQKNYGGDPTEWARAYADCGVRRLHLVDLEGAKEAAPKNLRTLEAIASLGLLKVEWGGGIKDDDALASVWNAGADWAIIGSIAAKEPELMLGWLRQYGSRIILGADVRDGKVAVSGWLEDSGIDLDDLIKEFLPAGLEQSIVTDISRDGMLQGPSFGAVFRPLSGTAGKVPRTEDHRQRRGLVPGRRAPCGRTGPPRHHRGQGHL